jgi:hypothetical protein
MGNKTALERFALESIQALVDQGHLISHGGWPSADNPQSFSLSAALQEATDGEQIRPTKRRSRDG